jgi:hypothetical protein
VSGYSGSGEPQLGAAVLLEDEAPAHWQPVAEQPLVVVVGVTGVGKSTTIGRLRQRMRCFLLPDRRELADRVVFPVVQDELGEPRHPVRDRVERFRLTARYRECHPGGLAHALSLLRVDPSALAGQQLMFDGLRGVEEIGWAIAHLPRTRFLALRAPESVRLLRLLGRAEGFDYAEVPAGMLGVASRDVASRDVASRGVASRDVATLLAAVPGLESLLSSEELASLLASPALAGVPLEEIARKAAILAEEARNYDPAATMRLLDAELGPWRRLIVNTAVAGPDEVAEQVARWLG